MDEETRSRFEAAVEHKKQEAQDRSQQHNPVGSPGGGDQSAIEGDQHSLVSDGRKTQDVFSVRDKNSGKGKKTADKWNQ